MAGRYGQLPSALAKISAEDYAFDLMVATIGAEEDAKQAAKQPRGNRAPFGKKR